MWTYNSSKTLETCLSSIDRAIPSEAICHKIGVDGGSEDSTADTLRRYGWTVEKSPRKGIPYQANYGLQLVDAPFFAAFEHDIILNPRWFARTSSLIISAETIGAVQGLRLFTGSKTMTAFDAWRYHTNRIPYWTWSIDNTFFRTEAVRRAGGFSDECMVSADAILRKNMFKLGYNWITDNTLISGHYRKNFLDHLRHQAKLFRLANYYWTSDSEDPSRLKRAISLVGGNPLNAVRMALDSRMLRILPAQYLISLQAAFYVNLFPLQNKKKRRIPMDDWFLGEFKRQVSSSKHYSTVVFKIKNPIAERNCTVCGKKSSFLYTIPRNWGVNIVPKLRFRMRREFAACSEAHADIVADKIFKNAFDYIVEEHFNQDLKTGQG